MKENKSSIAQISGLGLAGWLVNGYDDAASSELWLITPNQLPAQAPISSS